MKLAEGMTKAVVVGIVGAGLLLCGSVAKAEGRDVTGEYECTEAKVAGKSVPCKAAQLSLKGDGRFELEGREGRYLVAGNWVELTGTLLKSRARIEAGHKIVFRFYNKKGLCEMIYERRVAELGKTKLG
ncbi:MAG TPA: hypothetical protein VKH45_10910 [Candidatus Acidoferrum sp.]|nr:hypothetical protein [Candidatus Acidoferrum sp.]